MTTLTDGLATDMAWIVVWATAAGTLSMLLYRVASPQQRLRQLAIEATATRRALARHDGEFAAAWPLLRRSLAVSCHRLGAAFVPSLLAGVPVLLTAYAIQAHLSASAALPCGPAWLSSGWVAFFIATSVAALLVKFALKIQ